MLEKAWLRFCLLHNITTTVMWSSKQVSGDVRCPSVTENTSLLEYLQNMFTLCSGVSFWTKTAAVKLLCVTWQHVWGWGLAFWSGTFSRSTCLHRIGAPEPSYKHHAKMACTPLIHTIKFIHLLHESYHSLKWHRV